MTAPGGAGAPGPLGGTVLLLGASGQLGRDLADALRGPRLVPLTRRDLDVTDTERAAALVRAHAPGTVVNATAFNRVDDAERDPVPAFAVNAAAVHGLARACAEAGSRLLHFSTDYVFGGREPGPHAEEAAPAPLNAYGVSKLAGETLARLADPRHLVIRTCGLYGTAGSSGKGGNFVETMLRLAREPRPISVVTDQLVAPTYTADLAEAVRRLLALDPPGGVYHLTNAGSCSWFEFARAIFASCGLSPDLRPTTSAAFAAPARRAANSVLANRRATALGLEPLRPWPDALRAYLAATGRLPG